MPPIQLCVRCPAKINTYLRVLDKDASGYHPLETEFQAISLFDDLIITPGESGFEIEGPEAGDLAAEKDNSVLKAMRLLGEIVSLPKMHMRLVKRIPSQAGLGGGTSDAAGLIRAVQKLIPRADGAHEYSAIAKACGSDVPFFLVGGRAEGRGYGEKLTALPDQEPRFLVLALPQARCSTPLMYAALDAERALGTSPPQPSAWIENSFHSVAPKECLEAIEEMQNLGLAPCGLSGSGSAVFGFAKSEEEAHQKAKEFQAGRTWVCRTLLRSESMTVDTLKL